MERRIVTSALCLALSACLFAEETEEVATGGPPPLELGEVELRRPAGSGEPHLHVAPSGDVLLTWLEPVEEGRHALMLATRRDGAWSEPIRVRTSERFFVNWADFPSAVAMADGTLAVHWLERVAEAPYAYHVMISVSRDGGATWSEPIRAHRDDSATEHGFVSMVPWEEGAALVWLDGGRMAADARAGAMSLRFTTVGPDGATGGETELDDRTCECCQT
ncbi:MAG: sialidase family protein, partial [Gemmatimonadota bacterium]